MSFGFTFNGKHSSEFGLKVLQVDRGILPSVSVVSQNIPRMIGEQYFTKKYEAMSLVFTVLFIENDTAYMSKVREIAEWLNEEGLKELSVDDEPAKTYFATLHEESAIEEIHKNKQATFSFYVPQPIAYGVEETITKAMGSTSTYSRQGTAYQFDGAMVANNLPRFEPSIFTNGVFIEDKTTNLLPNPSFEDNTIGWETGGVTSIVGTSRKTGTKALRIDNNTGVGEGFASQTFLLPLTVGEAITTSAYVKNITGSAWLYVDFLDASQGKLHRHEHEVSGHASLERVSITSYAPAGTEYVKVWCYSGWNNASVAEWDDIQIERLHYSTTFVIGSRAEERLNLKDLSLLGGSEGAVHVTFKEDLRGGFRYLMDSTGADRFLIASDGANYVAYMNGNEILSTPMAGAGWHRLTVTWNGTVAELLLDGVIASTYTASSPLSINISQQIVVGSRNTYVEYYNTIFDEILFSDRHWTALETGGLDAPLTPTGNDILYPFNSNLNTIDSTGDASTLAFEVEGTLNTHPIIVVTCLSGASNFSLLNTSNGQYIKLNMPVLANDVITIDYGKNFVTINGASAMKALDITSSFDGFEKGTNNLNVTPSNCKVDMTYRSRWL